MYICARSTRKAGRAEAPVHAGRTCRVHMQGAHVWCTCMVYMSRTWVDIYAHAHVWCTVVMRDEQLDELNGDRRGGVYPKPTAQIAPCDQPAVRHPLHTYM